MNRGFREIRELIQSSALSDWVKARAIGVFKRIGEAEAKVHGVPLESIHFHEVGALDSLVDIVGACVALDLLDRPEVRASNVVEGQGWVRCAHGRFPVPTAATLEILGARGVALSQCDEQGELVTPTGAAILAEFVEGFGPMQGLVASKIGYGLGTRENKTRPNVLRAILGDRREESHTVSGTEPGEVDQVVLLETNLDDTTGEVLGSFVAEAIAARALDVTLTPIVMKKNRPGTMLSVLCLAEDALRFEEMILVRTTAFGVRRTTCNRRKLRREIRRIATAHGEVEIKLGWLGSRLVQVCPEFESCKRLAEARAVPIRTVLEAARTEALQAWPMAIG